MRITNSMITNNAAGNINGTKVLVDKTNTQMTTQKKISRPSEDPVIAIRSLRLQTSLNKINQYYEKNIPDAESWMDVTETALTNMKSIITDMRTLCVNGSTGTLTEDDRSTILTQLKALQEQVYNEGNADYAGRTVFTGYRTDKTLTFTTADSNTHYNITEPMSSDDIYRKRFYNGEVTVPTTPSAVSAGVTSDMDTQQTEYNVLRFAYDDLDSISSVKVTLEGGTQTDVSVTVYDTEADWAAANSGKKEVGENDVVIIKDTGEMIMGDTISNTYLSNNAKFEINYDKTGFASGELRPEYYFNCIQYTDSTGADVNGTTGIAYERFDSDGNATPYEIQYTVASNQELTVNMEANECIDHNIYQDMGDMIDIVQKAISANDKVDQINAMISSDQYAGEEYQTKLAEWLAAAQKEADYANDNLQKSYSEILGKVDNYLEDINLSITTIGCRGDQLEMTKTRMNNQQETVEELQSTNDDLDLSDIILKYTAAYTAYQSSLTAAGKLGQQNLLNYI